MKHNINDLTLEELDIILLALDYFLCNGEHNTTVAELAESLLLHLDLGIEEEDLSEDTPRIIEEIDNLIVVDFQPKNG
jgi:hypothetical protein